MWEIDPSKLKRAMAAAGLNQSQLATATGLQQPSIGRLVSGETKTTRKLDELAQALRVDPGDLVKTVTLAAERAEFLSAPAATGDVVEIDEIDVALGLGASYLEGALQIRRVAFSRSWLRHFTDSSPEYLFSAVGIGESMHPTIHSSDVVLVDRSDDTIKMHDQLWAIAYADTGAIKRLRPLASGGVEVMSSNPTVTPWTAYDDELHIIGRVVAIVRKT